MGKQVVRYRTCDKCPGDVPAAVTDKITFNGSRYDLDLCEKHSLDLFSHMMRWLDLGTKTGETGIFDQQQTARQVTVNVDPKPAAKLEEPKAAAATNVQPIKVVAGDPNLPLTAARWQLTTHAEQRREQRKCGLADVLWAAERPDLTTISKVDDSLEVRRRGTCKVVVDPQQNMIVTIIDLDEDARDEFVNEFLNRNREAQG